ncbi:glutathione synthase, partial [Rhizobium ruizarguesonis]
MTNVVGQTDHVADINIAGDSTLAMSLEAQARGYRLFHYTPDRLSFRENRLYASVEPMVLREPKGDQYELGAPERVDLA